MLNLRIVLSQMFIVIFINGDSIAVDNDVFDSSKYKIKI